MERVKYTIIGGGVNGSAVAYELSKRTNEDIVLLETNPRNGMENQSARNSGVIHAGIYYPKKKGPLKVRFCVEGNNMMYDFCEEHNIPHKKTGKLVVATNQLEEEYLDDVLEKARQNGVPGVKIINGEEAKKYEPNVRCTKAVYVPTSGVVEPTSLVRKLQDLSGEKLFSLYNNKVESIKPLSKGGFEVGAYTSGSDRSSFETDFLINAAGLFSDEIARMVNPDSPYEMEPVRGEAAKFFRSRSNKVSMNGMNVYPAPYGFYTDTGEKAEVGFKDFLRLLDEGKVKKTVGVHLTPTLGDSQGNYFDAEGNVVISDVVTVGPTSTVGIGKEDYGKNLHPIEHYFERVKDFFPGLRQEDLQLHQAGIRAVLKDHYDFVIENDSQNPALVNLVGIDSPGLTSSLAIARYVAEELLQ